MLQRRNIIIYAQCHTSHIRLLFWHQSIIDHMEMTDWLQKKLTMTDCRKKS